MAIQGLIPPAPAAAKQLEHAYTITNTNFVAAGVGGMRGSGSGNISLSGVTGPVTKALLYWNGPTDSTNPSANATVNFDLNPITGQNIGISSSNCWDNPATSLAFANGQSYRADVTAYVKDKRNGNYALSGFRKAGPPTIDINGASLIVFFTDPNSTVKKDVTIFDGNDSNIQYSGAPEDPAGWSASLTGINYRGGGASLQLHVSDGQNYDDAALMLNSAELVPAGDIFSGDSVPPPVTGTEDGAGNLWDIKNFAITSFMTTGVNNMTLTSSGGADCISLVVALVSVPTPITLTPVAATQSIGVEHTLTATIALAEAGINVLFSVESGPNAGTTGSANTDSSGRATFKYASNLPGSDSVTASFTDSGETIRTSNVATVLWTGVAGIANCPTTDGETVTPNELPGTTVKLFSGSVEVASTPAALVSPARYRFTGLAANATYGVRYTGAEGTPSCGVIFVTDATGSKIVPELEPVLYRKNSTWLSAYAGTNGAACDSLKPPLLTCAVSDSVPSGKSRWYVLRNVPAQSQVNVSLTAAEVDLTLVAYRDVRAVAERLNALIGSSTNVQTLTASQDIGADDMAGDDMAGDDMAGDDMAGDDMAGDDMAGDDMAGDDMAGDDMAGGGPGCAAPCDIAVFSDVYATAQPPSVLAVSATPGRAAEFLTINARTGGDLYFRVRKSIKELSPAEGQYSIMASYIAAPGCNTTAATAALAKHYVPTAPASMPTGKKTIILTNTQRYGLTGIPKSTFLTMLSNLASKTYVNGFVVDLADNAGVAEAYTDWGASPACVELANRVTDVIKDLVNLYRASNPLQYGVNAGGDRIVPLRRVMDPVRPPLKNEFQYSPPLAVGTAVDSSLAANYYLTADFYSASGPITRFGGEVWLPEFAWGILVETPDDISAYVNTFIAANGLVQNPGKALSMGFDWNADTAKTIADDIAATGANVTPVINTAAPYYTATDIRTNLINLWSTAGYLGVQGHASATSLKAADNLTHLSSSDIAGIAAGQPKTTGIFVTLSCHSSFNIQDGDVGNPLVQTLAWPEAFIAQGKTLLGGTGYQYAETVLIKNTERLLTLFTHELRFVRGIDAQGKALLTTYPSGEVPIGDAHVNAKRLYMSELTSFSAIDQKVLGVSAIFGLPMLRYDLPGSVGTQRLERTNPALISPLTPGVSDGLSRFDKGQTFTTLKQCDADGCAAGISGPSYFAETPELTHAIAFRPIIARKALSVDASGTVARGAVILDQRFTEESFGTPLTVLPVTEQPGTRPAYVSPVFSPWPVALNEYVNQQLVWMPTQYETDALGAYTVRKTNQSLTRIYYSHLTDQRALVDAPVVRSMSISASDGTVHLVLNVLVHTNVGIEAVWATSLGGVDGDTCLTNKLGSGMPCFVAGLSSASPLPMTAGEKTWDTQAGPAGCGSPPATPCERFLQQFTLDVNPGPAGPQAWRGFFQIVGGNGLVRLINNRGALFQVPVETATAATPKVATKLELTSPTPPLSAAFRSFINLTAKLSTDTSPSTPVVGKTVTFRLGSVTRSAVTDGEGNANVQLAVELVPRTPTPYQLLIGFAESGPSGNHPGYLATGLSQPITVTKAATVFSVTSPVPTLTYPGQAVIARLFLASPPATYALNEQLALIDLGANGKVLTTTDGFGDLLLDTTDFGDFAGLPPGDYTGTISTFENRLYFAASAPISFKVVRQTFPTARSVKGQGNFTTDASSIGLAPGNPATFEFNLQLAANSPTPTGNLAFNVKAQKFGFAATQYSWMSIVGNRAQVAGFGTLTTASGQTTNVPFRMIVDDIASGDRYEVRIGGTFAAPQYAAVGLAKPQAINIK